MKILDGGERTYTKAIADSSNLGIICMPISADPRNSKPSKL